MALVTLGPVCLAHPLLCITNFISTLGGKFISHEFCLVLPLNVMQLVSR